MDTGAVVLLMMVVVFVIVFTILGICHVMDEREHKKHEEERKERQRRSKMSYGYGGYDRYKETMDSKWDDYRYKKSDPVQSYFSEENIDKTMEEILNGGLHDTSEIDDSETNNLKDKIDFDNEDGMFVTKDRYNRMKAELAETKTKLETSESDRRRYHRRYMDSREKMLTSETQYNTIFNLYSRLQREHERLKQSKQSQSTSSGSARFTDAELRNLRVLCHPDKHGGSDRATGITAKLNNMIGKKR